MYALRAAGYAFPGVPDPSPESPTRAPGPPKPKIGRKRNMFKKKLDSNTIPNIEKSNLIDGRFKKIQRDLEELKLLVENSTNEGDTIYDPFAGSCSTLKTAKALNRNCKGSELSKEYCQMYADYENGLLL